MATDKDITRDVLIKAVIRAVEVMCIEDSVLGVLFGPSWSHDTKYVLKPGTTEWAKAVLFIRVYDSLYKLYSGVPDDIMRWVHAHNIDLKGRPIELMCQDNGLQEVVMYLESYIEK